MRPFHAQTTFGPIISEIKSDHSRMAIGWIRQRANGVQHLGQIVGSGRHNGLRRAWCLPRFSRPDLPSQLQRLRVLSPWGHCYPPFTATQLSAPKAALKPLPQRGAGFAESNFHPDSEGPRQKTRPPAGQGFSSFQDLVPGGGARFERPMARLPPRPTRTARRKKSPPRWSFFVFF